MSFNENLIIVADNKSIDYANYLMQLIGDKYSAAIFTEKVYLDSQPKISSKTSVLFLGYGETANSQRTAMNKVFGLFTMNCYLLGKRAVLQVDNSVLNNVDYDSFALFARKYGLAFTRPKASLKSLSLWLHPKYIIPWKAGKKIYPVTVYDQLFQCLIMVFYKDYLDDFIA